MSRAVMIAASVLGFSLFALGCSKDESAPPPAAVCTMMPNNIACERENGECAPLQCVGQNWECAPGETLIVLTPGRCSNDDAGNGDAGSTD